MLALGTAEQVRALRVRLAAASTLQRYTRAWLARRPQRLWDAARRREDKYVQQLRQQQLQLQQQQQQQQQQKAVARATTEAATGTRNDDDDENAELAAVASPPARDLARPCALLSPLRPDWGQKSGPHRIESVPSPGVVPSMAHAVAACRRRVAARSQQLDGARHTGRLLAAIAAFGTAATSPTAVTTKAQAAGTKAATPSAAALAAVSVVVRSRVVCRRAGVGAPLTPSRYSEALSYSSDDDRRTDSQDDTSTTMDVTALRAEAAG